jgi:hypothetical protein
MKLAAVERDGGHENVILVEASSLTQAVYLYFLSFYYI